MLKTYIKDSHNIQKVCETIKSQSKADQSQFLTKLGINAAPPRPNSAFYYKSGPRTTRLGVKSDLIHPYHDNLSSIPKKPIKPDVWLKYANFDKHQPKVRAAVKKYIEELRREQNEEFLEAM